MPDDVVNLVDDHGRTITAPADQAGSLVAQGWRSEQAGDAAQRVSDEARHETYGGVVGGAAAFGAGALSGASLGLSDLALSGLGYGDDVQALRDEHPYAAGAGQLAGALAPALLGDEAGLANFTPAGFASRIGARIAEGTPGVLGTAAAGAFEGAAQNAGAYVSDVALGNRDLSAEGFLGAMGKGALYGGVAGGALSVASNGLIAARRLLPAADYTPEGVAAAKFGAQRSIGDSIDTSNGLERAGQQAVVKTDRETQQFITDLEQERSAALGRAAQTRTAEEGALAGPPVDPVTGETTLPQAQPPKDPRELMAAWRDKHPEGAVDFDAATAASRRQRLSDWAKDFEAKTPEDATIKAYFSEPMDPMRTAPGDRVGLGDTPKAVQQVARKAAADASHHAYLEATAQGANVAKSGAELMARATYAGRKAAASAMDDVYAAYAAGKPIVDIRAAATAKLSGHLHELAEARADMIQSLAAKPASADLMAQLTGTKAAVDAGQPLSLGQRILQGVEKPVDPDEAVANALGKSKDVNEDISDIAPKITRYEAAKANLTEAIGDSASPAAKAHAEQFRAAQQQAANSNARASAQTVEGIDGATRGVPSEQLPSGRPTIGGLAKRASDLGAVYEGLRSLGVPLPDPKNIPVIGPILSVFLKAKLISKIAGQHGGSFAATAEGTIAAKAVETQNRISAAVGKMINNTADRITARAPDIGGAAALGYKLFDDGKKTPYSSKPAAGELGDQFRDRLTELSSAMQPGAIEQAIKSRINASDPTILDALIATETRRLQYLYNAAPKPDAMPFPGQEPRLPSKVEMLTFGNAVAAYHDPPAIFERVAAGGVARPNEIDCVKNCYPQLYAAAQGKLVDMLSKADAPIPYMRRVAISALTGIPMDATLTSDHAAYLQAGFGTPAAQSPVPMPHPTLTSSISVGDRTLTRLDR